VHVTRSLLKKGTLLGGAILLAAAGLSAGADRQFKIARGTLILIGVTEHEITLASDSLSVDSRNGSSETQKFYRAGKFSACGLAGQVSVRLHVGNDGANLAAEVRHWLVSHPQNNVAPAFLSLSKIAQTNVEEFMQRHPERVERRMSSFSTELFCVGFDGGKSVILSEKFTADVEAGTFLGKPSAVNLVPGFFLALGVPTIANELTSGSDKEFDSFRSDPAVKKYLALQARGRIHELTWIDFLRLSKVCLEATESDVGRKFDPDATIVGPPNRFAKISDTIGFTVQRPPFR
jgi:hypothetical protein